MEGGVGRGDPQDLPLRLSMPIEQAGFNISTHILLVPGTWCGDIDVPNGVPARENGKYGAQFGFSAALEGR